MCDTMTDEHLLTAQDVAARCGVSVRTIARWASSGVLAPSQKLPGKNGAYLFHPDTVDQHIADASRMAGIR